LPTPAPRGASAASQVEQLTPDLGRGQAEELARRRRRRLDLAERAEQPHGGVLYHVLGIVQRADVGKAGEHLAPQHFQARIGRFQQPVAGLLVAGAPAGEPFV
jgi:hypothetical protein